jgi:hypothetical protein
VNERELAAALERAATRPPRLLTPLPLRVRLRLATARAIDTIGCWLCDHHRPGMAMLLWRVCGLWRKRQATMDDVTTPVSVMDLCTRAYHATSNWERGAGHLRWVMDRSWYDRLRAQVVPEDQEAERARAHASAWIEAAAEPPHRCPVCPGGPFGTMKELTAHIGAMADPANREPSEGDQLFGIALEVRDDGGEPHLETVP